MSRRNGPALATFTGANGKHLIADVYGDTPGETRVPVLLLHGGGQTRHAWRKTAEALASAGHVAYALDQRGHGDSDWDDDGAYAFSDFAADARVLARELALRHNAKPIAIGASLGGIASLLAQGEAAKNGDDLFAVLVLVDITPRVDPQGVDKVHAFMRAHAAEGFASVTEAAEAVAAYLPHRPRPRSQEGLKKNLRLSPDGRWRWHWDPRFMDGPRAVHSHHDTAEAELVAAARRVAIPAFLVRGAASELVREEHVKEFLELVPHAEYADVGGARHMVAGDRNDAFSTAVLDFVARFQR